MTSLESLKHYEISHTSRILGCLVGWVDGQTKAVKRNIKTLPRNSWMILGKPKLKHGGRHQGQQKFLLLH